MKRRNVSFNSGFTGPYGESGSLSSGYACLDERYYDTYQYGTNTTEYTKGHLGDATSEVGPFTMVKYGNQNRQIGSWYADRTDFVIDSHPWFVRGDNYENGSESGVFAFAAHYGSAQPDVSFRVILTPIL